MLGKSVKKDKVNWDSSHTFIWYRCFLCGKAAEQHELDVGNKDEVRNRCSLTWWNYLAKLLIELDHSTN